MNTHDKKPTATKHQEYYFSDGDITIRVENTVFRIDKHFLTRHSNKLRSILEPIIPSCEPHPPGSEANPAVLDEATSEEFASLLWVFYTDFSYKAPVEKWTQILELAHQWGIARVEKLCIEELAKLRVDPVEKIELYQKLELNANLLRTSFVELAKRPEPLELNEVEKIGLKTSTILWKARERARDPGQPRILQESDVEELIEEAFGLQGSTPPSVATSPVRENTTMDEHMNWGGKRPKKNHASRGSFNKFGF